MTAEEARKIIQEQMSPEAKEIVAILAELSYKTTYPIPEGFDEEALRALIDKINSKVE